MSEVESQLFTIFQNFIRDLSKTYPEIKNCLYRNYEEFLISENNDRQLKDFPKLQNFLNILHVHGKYITDKNLEFFDLEINLLEEISFKNLWEKNISNKTRENIWKYLQTFEIININLESSEKLKDALSQIGTETTIEVDRKTAKELRTLKKLSSDVSKNKEDEFELDGMLGDLLNTDIGNIAKEVAENININDIMGDLNEESNPAEVISKLMNPEKMNDIFKNINSVMENKMSRGELSKEGLKNEAESMMAKMGGNDLFKNMMDQIDPTNNNPDLSREEKQEKLRQKIKEKKNNR